jgi:hypothetical protein
VFALTNDHLKASRERRVFDLFVQRSGLRVKAETILQSAPDFQCNLEDGQGVSFELMTLDSEDSSRLVSSFHTTGYAWQRAIDGLTAPHRALFMEIYSDATVALEFRDRPDMRARLQRLREVVACLLKQPGKFKGVLEVNGDKVTVAQRLLGREALPGIGPVGFDTIQSAPKPIVWTRIREKVDPKCYRMGGRCELIAYAFRDTLFNEAPGHASVPRADIRDWLRGSAFARVWVVEWRFKHVYGQIERPAA